MAGQTLMPQSQRLSPPMRRSLACVPFLVAGSAGLVGFPAYPGECGHLTAPPEL
jgi:hypothetical protein